MQLPGESANQCRLRVMQECSRRWNAATAEERATFSSKAMVENRRAQLQDVSLVNASRADQNASLARASQQDDATRGQVVGHENANISHTHIAQLQNFYDIGDSNFGISRKTVESAEEQTPSFVNTFSSAWRARVSERCPDSAPLEGTVPMSCQEEFGFCTKSISDMNRYRAVVAHLEKFVAQHRRKHLVNGKNAGPKDTIQHPLLRLTRTEWTF